MFVHRPDTQSYIEKLKREEQERAKGQTEDKRSFLAKYVSTMDTGIPEMQVDILPTKCLVVNILQMYIKTIIKILYGKRDNCYPHALKF